MGILHHRKDDWSETLYKTYAWDIETDDEELIGFEMLDKPYESKFDMSKNSTFHMFDRNNFNDDNYFDDTTRIDRETYSDRI